MVEGSICISLSLSSTGQVWSSTDIYEKRTTILISKISLDSKTLLKLGQINLHLIGY